MSSARYPPVFDGHMDTVLSLASTGRSFFERSAQGHVDLPRAREGGLGGGFCAIYLSDPQPDTFDQADSGTAMDVAQATNIPGFERYTDERTFPEPMSLEYAQNKALTLMGKLIRLEEASDGQCKIVRTGADVQACMDNGTFAMLLHFEGAEPLDFDGDALEVFYRAGVRSVGLTHSRRNRFATGVPFKFPASPDTGSGLTDRGKDLIRHLNRKKIMIDLSHITEKGFWDVAAMTDAPLVATHSSAWDLSASPRNLTLKQLAAVRESRGMIGLNFHVGFLRKDGSFNTDVPLSVLVDHIDRLVDQAGIDCVGLGSDFDGAIMPDDLKDAAALPALMAEISKRGYGDEEMRKLAHANWVRVLTETWGA
jgi:membrane dipeptidase